MATRRGSPPTPSTILARRLSVADVQAIAELAGRWEGENARLEAGDATAVDFAEWIADLRRRGPPHRPCGSRDRHPDAYLRRSAAQRRRRESERAMRVAQAA